MSFVLVQTTAQLAVKFRNPERWTANCFTIKGKQTLSKLLRDTEGHLNPKFKPRNLIIVGSPLTTDDNVRDHSVNLEITEAPKRKSNKLRTIGQDVF